MLDYSQEAFELNFKIVLGENWQRALGVFTACQWIPSGRWWIADLLAMAIDRDEVDHTLNDFELFQKRVLLSEQAGAMRHLFQVVGSKLQKRRMNAYKFRPDKKAVEILFAQALGSHWSRACTLIDSYGVWHGRQILALLRPAIELNKVSSILDALEQNWDETFSFRPPWSRDTDPDVGELLDSLFQKYIVPFTLPYSHTA